MAGLGSRHNVVKWGCGAKEARISQAAHWRPYYEAPGVSNNEAAQTGVSTIEILVRRKDALPTEVSARIGRPPRGGG